jgi:hypothetical protein
MTQTTESTSARTQGAASTAADEGKHVADTAKEQATQVASEAAGAAKNVADDVVRNATDAAREHGSTQRDKLVGTLTTLTDDLSGMAQQAPPGLAGDLARQAADHARALTTRLENRDPGEILEDVRGFARQRPGVFLLGALAAGVVTGRLLAGARDGIAAAEAANPTGASAPTPTTEPTTAPTTAPTTGATYVPDPLTSPSMPGQPTHDPLQTPDTGLLDGPESGYSGGGLGSEDPR